MFDLAAATITTKADIYDENGILLIAKGIPITRDVYEKLHSRKLIQPSNIISNEIQQASVLTVPTQSDHENHHCQTTDNLFSQAARITQQAIETTKLNPHLRKQMQELVQTKALFYDHSVNVAQLSTKIALKLNLHEEEVFAVSLGALLHDIGRNVTENSTTSFVMTNADLIDASVKHHPIIGNSMLQKAGLPESVCLVALQHHERFSGKGYPRGLTYYETHFHAQIVMLADVFEALTTRHLKNKTFSIDEGLAIIQRGRGTEFNPDILDALSELMPDHV